MSEERTNELMEMENTGVTEYTDCEYSESSGGGLGKVLVCAVVGVVAGVGALVYKNKDKIKAKHQEKRIAKCCKELEKYGCTVVRDEEILEDEFDEDVIEEEIIEEETK